MSDPFDALLVDIGNSRIKWALVNRGEDFCQVHVQDSIEAMLPMVKQASQVIAASVGHASQCETLTALCQHHGRQVKFIQTAKETFGIQCAYESYQTLGVDRWLAVLAARAITDLPAVVIDLGTAATCDVIIGNQHAGGWIAPGFELMKSGLFANTQGVFGVDGIPASFGLGKSTEACVDMGCLAALRGIILMARQYIGQRAEDYRVIVSGGAAPLVRDMADDKTVFIDNIVLSGLMRFL